MAKEPSGSQENEIELKPEGWAQFERAVDAAIKSGPKHKSKANAKSSPGAASDSGKSKQMSK
jgi:hypothetical protein